MPADVPQVAPTTTALLIVVSTATVIAAVVSGMRRAVNAVNDEPSWSSPIPVIDPEVPVNVTRPLYVIRHGQATAAWLVRVTAVEAARMTPPVPP